MANPVDIMSIVDTTKPRTSVAWRIVAGLVNKTPLRHYNNSRGHGSVFSIELQDASGTLHGVFFNDNNTFFDSLEVGKGYMIQSRGAVKHRNGGFDTVFNQDTVITPTEVDAATHLAKTYSFADMSVLPAMNVNSVVDTIGVVTDVSMIKDVDIKRGVNAGHTAKHRMVKILTLGEIPVRLTLWDRYIDDIDEGAVLLSTIVVCHRMNVTEYQGIRSLSTGVDSSIISEPLDVPEYTLLSSMIEKLNLTDAKFLLSHPVDHDTKTFGTLESAIDQASVGDEFVVELTGKILAIRQHNFTYQCCPTHHTKVNDDAYCDRCKRTIASTHRYATSMKVGDESGGIWVVAFDVVGMQLFGLSAPELVAQPDPTTAMNAVLEQTFDMKIEVKIGQYVGLPSVHATLTRLESSTSHASKRARHDSTVANSGPDAASQSGTSPRGPLPSP